MSEVAYWLIANLSYADTIKLQGSDLVEHYVRDTKRSEVKFWPGSKGVLTYLQQNLPEGAVIANESGTSGETSKFRAPPVIHRGMDIADD